MSEAVFACQFSVLGPRFCDLEIRVLWVVSDVCDDPFRMSDATISSSLPPDQDMLQGT